MCELWLGKCDVYLLLCLGPCCHVFMVNGFVVYLFACLDPTMTLWPYGDW